MSKHIIVTSATPKSERSLCRYGRHRWKEGTLTRELPCLWCGKSADLIVAGETDVSVKG
ncbi:MAG: hypothetical protein U5K69_21580 [Balneolaceae bacterium]|nr:hypothetical protein [Balneolaceae bacterium]